MNVYIINGQKGGEIISDTATHAGPYTGIQALTACTFTSLTTNWAGLSTATLPAGASLLGYFAAVKLAGGTLAAAK